MLFGRKTDFDFFPSTVYDNTPAQGILQSTDPDIVFSELNAHFAKFIDNNMLTRDEADVLLQRFQDQIQRQVFTNPATGNFEPQLMAAVLATAGTVANDWSPRQNQTGRAARIVYADLRRLVSGNSIFCQILSWQGGTHTSHVC